MTTITITLSDRAPVRIDPEAWPVIASASDHDGQVRCQANTEWWIKVRENADGRRIVYGAKEAGNGGQHRGFRSTYPGWLIEAVDGEMRQPADGGPLTSKHPDVNATVRAIRRVAGAIGRDDLGTDCIGDLPAEDI